MSEHGSRTSPARWASPSRWSSRTSAPSRGSLSPSSNGCQPRSRVTWPPSATIRRTSRSCFPSCSRTSTRIACTAQARSARCSLTPLQARSHRSARRGGGPTPERCRAWLSSFAAGRKRDRSATTSTRPHWAGSSCRKSMPDSSVGLTRKRPPPWSATCYVPSWRRCGRPSTPDWTRARDQVASARSALIDHATGGHGIAPLRHKDSDDGQVEPCGQALELGSDIARPPMGAGRREESVARGVLPAFELLQLGGESLAFEVLAVLRRPERVSEHRRAQRRSRQRNVGIDRGANVFGDHRDRAVSGRRRSRDLDTRSLDLLIRAPVQSHAVPHLARQVQHPSTHGANVDRELRRKQVTELGQVFAHRLDWPVQLAGADPEHEAAGSRLPHTRGIARVERRRLARGRNDGNAGGEARFTMPPETSIE